MHLHHLQLLHVSWGTVHARVLAHVHLRNARVLANMRGAIHHDAIVHVHGDVHVCNGGRGEVWIAGTLWWQLHVVLVRSVRSRWHTLNDAIPLQSHLCVIGLLHPWMAHVLLLRSAHHALLLTLLLALPLLLLLRLLLLLLL